MPPSMNHLTALMTNLHNQSIFSLEIEIAIIEEKRLLDIILGKVDHQNLIDRIFLLLCHHSRMKLI